MLRNFFVCLYNWILYIMRKLGEGSLQKIILNVIFVNVYDLWYKIVCSVSKMILRRMNSYFL